ncbi:MAG: ArsR/SmtB family transcription factor [Alphaproteobacteria bacterium]
MTHGLILSALADPTRRQVFEALRVGPAPVGEIASRLPVSRPAVSQHLKILLRAGLVRERRVGRRNFYDATPGGLDALRRYLEEIWGQVPVGIKAAAEEEGGAR